MEPITKVRYKEKKWRSYAIALWICFLSCQLFLGSEAALARCDKTPRDQGGDRIPGDNGFSVIVSGMPRKYRPNQVYTMIIKVDLVNDVNLRHYHEWINCREKERSTSPNSKDFCWLPNLLLETPPSRVQARWGRFN